MKAVISFFLTKGAILTHKFLPLINLLFPINLISLSGSREHCANFILKI
jgi:hypothetical protein